MDGPFVSLFFFLWPVNQMFQILIHVFCQERSERSKNTDPMEKNKFDIILYCQIEKNKIEKAFSPTHT